MRSPIHSDHSIPIHLFHLILLLLVLFCLNACATKKAYSGPDLAPDKIAMIEPDMKKAFTEIRIISIDDHKLNFLECDVAVWPGIHKMLIDVKLDFPYLDHILTFSQNIAFKAEAGRIYTVQAKIDPVNNEGFLWVTSDTEPNQFIGGAKLGSIKVLSSNR
jgi:hypothetical protein